ncbi:MAG TPA: type IV toxin-antitoxin system AbiEi family antitoxin domain-containing protein [Acidimicrobiales bacterium]
MNDLDRRIASLTARQHGLVTRGQLRSGGASPAAVRTRTGAGRLHRVAEGVYRVGGAPVTWESEVLAAVLAGGPNAVASHRAAAALWGLDGCRPGRPEVTVPPGRRYRPATARVHQSTDLPLITPVSRSGVPTTPIDRTLLDLGAVVPPTRLHLALDHALRSGLTSVDRVLGALARHARRGRRGVGPLRELVAAQLEQDAVPDSGFERLVAILLREVGLPRPTLQHPVTIGGSAYRIDLC